MDNAATSYPKPKSVLCAVRRALSSPLGNPGRSGHAAARAAGEIVFSAREALAQLLGLEKPENITFTYNASYALNLAIRGTVEALFGGAPIDVVTSCMEHNSVLRPLYALEREGKIRLHIFSPAGNDGDLAAEFLSFVPPGAKLCVLTATGNVTGYTFPLEAIAGALRKRGVILILDASQALGCRSLNFKSVPADILCAPGHKGLLGIMGAGLIAFHDDSDFLPEAVLSGGSGLDSYHTEMPALLPERMEAGTLGVPAIAAMRAGAEYLLSRTPDAVFEQEKECRALLVQGLQNIPGISLYGAENPVGPLLFTVSERDPNEIADSLDQRGVMVRSGVHCAPLVHKFLGTAPLGGVRLSPGPFTRKREILFALEAIRKTAANIR